MERSDISLFDILQTDLSDSASYCQALIDKIFNLPYAELPDFYAYHCDFATDPLKWLNKFEKLIAENEELFVNSVYRSRMIKCFTIIVSKRKEIEQT